MIQFLPEYLTAMSAAIVGAICFNATRMAFVAGRRWLALAVLTLVLFIEALTSVGNFTPAIVRIARDAACVWVLLDNLSPRKTKR